MRQEGRVERGETSQDAEVWPLDLSSCSAMPCCHYRCRLTHPTFAHRSPVT